MVINVHAGHNPDGKIACGAAAILRESTEARRVKNEVIRQLQLLGHTVYDCTCDNGNSQQDVLNKILAKCDAHKVKLDVSIHFNSAANDLNGDGKTTGTEVYIYSPTAGAKTYAERTVNAIAKLGFRNRGVKSSVNLRVLRETAAPAMLIECCFVDDKDDAMLYNVESMASAIVYGITGEYYTEPVKPSETAELYRVQVGAFKNKANAEKLLADLKAKGFTGYITK